MAPARHLRAQHATRPGQVLAGADVEPGAVEWTGDGTAADLPPCQREPHMRAFVLERAHGAVHAGDPHVMPGGAGDTNDAFDDLSGSGDFNQAHTGGSWIVRQAGP